MISGSFVAESVLSFLDIEFVSSFFRVVNSKNVFSYSDEPSKEIIPYGGIESKVVTECAVVHIVICVRIHVFQNPIAPHPAWKNFVTAVTQNISHDLKRHKDH